MKPIIEIENLSKSYAGKQVLSHVNFVVYPQEILVIMGASGAGKSTLLNIIGQLDHQFEGEVRYDSQIFQDCKVPFPIVFQEFESLLPWKSVEDNIKLINKDISENELDELLKIVELEAHRTKNPSELSGGMKQRVCIAQALVCHSKILLMDEPFGSLDAALRNKLQEIILKLKNTRDLTILFVTHDLEEANRMGDRIINL